MSEEPLSGGTVHQLPPDLHDALAAVPSAVAAWESLTPLARNEWICWTTYVKQPKTRAEHVERVVASMQEGKRRPCCWMGCVHRTDKEISPSVRGILERRTKSK